MYFRLLDDGGLKPAILGAESRSSEQKKDGAKGYVMLDNLKLIPQRAFFSRAAGEPVCTRV